MTPWYFNRQEPSGTVVAVEPSGKEHVIKGGDMNSVAGRALLDAMSAALSAPAVPDGWMLVPIEPTPEMVRAAHNCMPPVSRKWHAAIKEKWAAMLAAAPSPQEQTR